MQALDNANDCKQSGLNNSVPSYSLGICQQASSARHHLAAGILVVGRWRNPGCHPQRFHRLPLQHVESLQGMAPVFPGIICTAGTTASVAFIRRGRVYVGHVGDSGIALGKMNEYQNHIRASNESVFSNRSINLPATKAESHFEAMMLTKDHKPESAEEKERIEALGRIMASNRSWRVVRMTSILPVSMIISTEMSSWLYRAVLCTALLAQQGRAGHRPGRLFS